MDDTRFDALTRALATTGASRRQLLARLAAGTIGGALAIGGARAAGAKDEGKGEDKGKGKDKGKDKGGDQGHDNQCHEEGHPCEGNQDCCAGLACAPSGPGNASRCTAGGAATVQAAAYRVEVACRYDAAADRTTCSCTGVAPAGAAAVTRVALPAASGCVEVVDGSFNVAPPAGGVRVTGYASKDGQAALTLVLAGQVTTGGTATYWCTTAAGTVPAPGPGLVRVADDLSDSTGAIVVEAAACDTAAPAAGFDWHGRCARPAVGAAFALAAWDGATFVPRATGAATADGRLRFRQLPPGTYKLTQTNGTWCHAECDSVDQRGNVVVKAGQRSTVWIFACGAAK